MTSELPLDTYGAVLYSRWLELWNGDLTIAEDLITADCEVHQAPLGADKTQRRRGPKGIKQLVEQGRAPFSEITFAVEVEPFGDGEHLAARWVATGVYGGGLPGATAKAGTKVTFRGNDIMRLEAGRIAEYWVSSDGAHLMAQLGMLASGDA